MPIADEGDNFDMKQYYETNNNDTENNRVGGMNKAKS